MPHDQQRAPPADPVDTGPALSDPALRVLANAALFRLVVDFQGGLPFRLHRQLVLEQSPTTRTTSKPPNGHSRGEAVTIAIIPDRDDDDDDAAPLLESMMADGCGALTRRAVRLGDLALLDEIRELRGRSSYYTTLPVLGVGPGIMALAAHGGHVGVLAGLHRAQSLHHGDPVAPCTACDPRAQLVAARRGHLPAVAWLERHCDGGRCRIAFSGADVVPDNDDDERGNSWLTRATHVPVLTFFLDHRPALDVPTLLLTAAARGHLEALTVLHARVHHRRPREQRSHDSTSSDATTDQDKNDNNINDHRDHRHPQSRVDVHRCPPSLMNRAAAHGHLPVVAFLHERCPVGGGATPAAFDYAATHGHLEVVRYLHAHRPEGGTPYAMTGAARHGHLAVVRFLHEHVPTALVGCSASSSSALAEAAEHGHLPVVRYLVEHAGDAPWADSGLYRAARGGHLEVVRYLCEHTKPGNRLFDARRAALSVVEASNREVPRRGWSTDARDPRDNDDDDDDVTSTQVAVLRYLNARIREHMDAEALASHERLRRRRGRKTKKRR